MKPVLLFSLFWVVVVALSVTPVAISQQNSRSVFSESSAQGFGHEKGGLGKGGGFGVIYAFKGGAGGAGPAAALIEDSAGNLYGTTSQGGDLSCPNSPNVGCGVVFRLDTRNREKVLHAFAGGASDGATPYGRLVMDGPGNLYGTTSSGGAFGLGTVFKIDPSGTEKVLYSFSGGIDGANPYAGLVMDGADDLYGTTENGGASNSGTVFKIDASGNEMALYSFKGGTVDGADPKAGLTLDSIGNLYGTTFSGGSGGYGTVFELNPNGTETILWNFTDGADGGNPFGGVIRDANGILYGTTENGGSTLTGGPSRLGGGPVQDRPHGCCVGIAYSLDGSQLSVLYAFTGGNDGGNPASDLVMNNGVLYGTTLVGGPGHRGTAFSLTIATRSETVLHGFTGKADGGTPQAGLLLNAAGVLYGTAEGGGRNQKGTVFKYKLK